MNKATLVSLTNRTLTIAIAFLVWAYSAPAMAQPSKPNVLVIMVDDLGYGDLSSYGATDLESPAIDGLAARGMKMVNFYANCPVCSPTRASFLTGLYPPVAGVPGVIRTHAKDNWGRLRPDVELLPQALKKVGYQTALIGKWHLGLEKPDRPHDRGFDLFHGFLGDMMDDYYNHRRHGNNYMRRGDKVLEPKGHATDLFTDWACAYLETRKTNVQPFFLFLSYNAPHTPIQPPKEWVEKVKKREPGIADKRAKLVALIEHMDAGIGRVLDKLRETGLEENTLVIFTSDNGGQVNVGARNGPVRAGKGTVYEGGIRVATIAAWPGRIAAGSVSAYTAITMDLYPTIASAAGAEIEQPIDGLGFLPVLLGHSIEAVQRDLFFTRREGGLNYGGKTIDAIRRGDWKLLQNSPYGPLELYNLRDDPLEMNDLRSKRPKIFRQLAEALRRQEQRYGVIPWQRPEQAAAR